jgi:DNA-binding NarL/FixJ family response regulator
VNAIPQRSRETALVAEDHELYRVGLASVLQRHHGFGRVIQAACLDDAVQALGDHPEVSFATFDLGMPGMCNASRLRGIRQAFPELVVAVVSASEDRRDVLEALAAGAHGYVPKSFDSAALARALGKVLDRRVFVPWLVTDLGLEEGLPVSGPLPSVQPRAELTRRQRDVLQLLRQRQTNKQIAKALGLTENTVKAHTVALYRMLGVKGRQGAVTVGTG